MGPNQSRNKRKNQIDNLLIKMSKSFADGDSLYKEDDGNLKGDQFHRKLDKESIAKEINEIM